MATNPNLRSGSSPPTAPRLLTIKQAAAYCACAVWAIRQAIWSKELPAGTIGRRLLIDRAALDSFIDDRLRERAS
jgi:excisionase family DNA binding protein